MRNPRLSRIQDWPQLAHNSGYSVKRLAQKCGVSVRALELFFASVWQESPCHWLKRLRMQRAVELLHDGSNVNETADCLGYHDRSHFSREFTKHYGMAPRSFALRLNCKPTASFAHSAT
jgi:AraC-like DNA-binding protein